MTRFSKNQVALGIALSGLVLSGAVWGGTYWAKGKSEEAKLIIAGLAEKFHEARRKILRIPLREKDLIILRGSFPEQVKILPEKNELTQFAGTIDRFALESGVAISSRKTRSGRTTLGYLPHSYSMAFTCTLWQFMKFMNRIESFEVFATVKAFTITAGQPDHGKKPGDVVHEFTMAVTTYVYDPPADGVKVAKIANYDAKHELLRQDIDAARGKIQIENYAFEGRRARRDIFVDPRPVSEK